MAEILRPDLCVVGAGPGGFTAAATAALFGAPVVLVANQAIDGPWRSAGAAASAALSYAGAHVRAARDSAFLGMGTSTARINHPRVHAHVQRVVAASVAEESPYRLAALGVRVLQDEARFIDRRSLLVGETTVTPRRFLIATGSEPVIPDIPGLADIDVLTDDSILDTTHHPERLVIIGAGRTGVTLAQAQRRLGAEVTLIDRGPALRREDAEIAAFALAALRQEGITIHERATIKRVEATRDAKRVDVETEADGSIVVEASHICVAVGRKPTFGGLDLQAAGVATGGAGIALGRGSATSNRRIYALGLASGEGADSHFAAHLAKDEARRIVRGMLFRAAPAAPVVPRLTMTDPEIATVGLSEAEARARYGDVRILRAPFAQNERAEADRAVAGEIKVVLTRRGRILGCAIAGAAAGELIIPWTLAIAEGLTIAQVSRLEMPTLTYSAVSRDAALSFYAPQTRSRWVRGMARFLRLFG
ncbi:FAD-dependent oxidoreductase [Chelatococcus asaccharovorans]|uniref:FAD-dependent oxidoreductase n=1 Tax=Chelatococcus asaccharovorans TaxID=28210 RepID=UPI00224C7954|nr:FAD-dependent oxidoreductase [Chelatococcus asaccharovorans]CAH1665109.1 Pyruvate/2-oxoglutarate dehydrogenase complex dihydrolipoamide dehydrogenase (E3) component [Chelatococcus asaccharovorans]CAH1682103.1 Pyruvate/2-oxoglutarate dehydrogenase complex dihydrolipoamide dehydrogenase (E3) component [Chelatococcus asaccharovorans]